MRVGGFACYSILLWSLFLASPASAQGPSKAAAKSITVYQDPG
jgi:hypothetical protein